MPAERVSLFFRVLYLSTLIDYLDAINSLWTVNQTKDNGQFK